VNGNEATYFSQWLQNSGWRYIAVTVIKNSIDTSALTGPIA
jgi:hypothetical protein